MSFFKVLNEEEFEEVRKMPRGFSVWKVKARILPDRNYIRDMIVDFHRHWEEIDEAAYNEVREMAEDVNK